MNAPWESHRPVNNSSALTLTLAAVPAKAPRHVRGFDGPFLAGLQKHKQPLQLVRDAGNRILLRLLKLPAGRWRIVNYTTWKRGTERLAETSSLLVECISELGSHKQGLQEAVQVAGHSLVDQANVT